MFFELLQVALGNREGLSRVPTDEEWKEMYEESGRQALTGILLHGIDRLPAEQRPSQVFLLQWIGEGQMIEQQNLMMDKRCCQLLGKLNDYGLCGTILKGQGIARLYNDNLNVDDAPDKKGSLGKFRQPGDIDVYVDCGLRKALEFAEYLGQKNVEWDYKHLHLKIWDDTEVEMHYRVEVLLNLWKNRRLQRWFKGNTALLFRNDSGLTTPTTEFNVFYILLHIYRHFLYEGVGLRQIVDYYMVLRTVQGSSTSKATKSIIRFIVQEYVDAVREFGMEKFARGLMWVMHEALDMPHEWMLWEPDEKEGRYILKQVMTGGNFGHHDKRLKHGEGKLGAVKAILTHNLHLLTHYPSDVIWSPVWIVWHKLWKLTRR